MIGSRASYLPSVEAARDAIAGWVLVNDVSERSFQTERGGQWMKGKSAETFNPAGPLARDSGRGERRARPRHVARGQPRPAPERLDIDHDLRPYFVVQYISQFLVLEPGDLINTGTPPGVGMGLDPPGLAPSR